MTNDGDQVTIETKVVINVRRSSGKVTCCFCVILTEMIPSPIQNYTKIFPTGIEIFNAYRRRGSSNRHDEASSRFC